MSKQTEALKLALEKVQEFKARWWKVPPFGNKVNKATREAITNAHSPIFELENTIREALAHAPSEREQPAQQQAYEQANPLGGPAKVFDAMADAIRAGDSYHAVLRQYGYAEAQQQEPVANELKLHIIRKWPEGFQDRLQHVWLDVVSFIPDVKLYDLQRVLAEFGFTMKVYEGNPPASKPLTDEEIKRLKPISADFVSFRAGVRCMEREYRIGEKR